MWSARGQSRSSISISSPIVLGDGGGGAWGTPKKCSKSVHGGIGIGDSDIDKRLAKFIIGDHGSDADLIPTNGAGGVNKGWVGLVVSLKGGVVGEDIPTLVDLGDKGVVIFLLSIGCDKGGEDIWGNERHVVRFWLLFCMFFILLVPLNLAKSSGACKLSALTHESCAGEYPFHLTRYCFFFHHPYVRTFDYLFYFPFFFAFNDIRWWFNKIGTVLIGFFVRYKKGGMEYIIYFPGGWEAEFVSDIWYFGGYHKWSIPPWC